MKEKLIAVTQEELEKIVFEEVQKERLMLFKLYMEDYILLPTYNETIDGKQIVMLKKAWEEHLEQLGQLMGDLDIAREHIKQIEPIYHEYFRRYYYEQTNTDVVANMIASASLACDADELERIRDRIEQTYYERLDSEAER